MAGPVPVARSLRDIYPEDTLSSQSKRWSALLSTFEGLHGHPADFVSRSPGRVNIIGEHIDYSLYSVLPMAITADTILAVSAYDDPSSNTSSSTFTIQISNIHPEKYPTREFEVPVDGPVEIDATQHEWSNYFKSGLRGALELLRTKYEKEHKNEQAAGLGLRPKSMKIVVDGAVPIGAGLSSSAAFVTSSALAVMKANGHDAVDKTELTELAIVSERAVGVNSGGMDQSASVFSERGAALFVSFVPRLTARPVFFPTAKPSLVFLVAQSFVTSNKYVTGPIHYNLRVVECTLAASYLHAVLNPPGTQLPADNSPLGASLHGFHETYFYHQRAPEGGEGPEWRTQEGQLRELIRLAKETLTREEGYTREEVASVLGLTVAELEAQFTTQIPIRAERFKLRQRALHVYGEALRTLEFLALVEGAASGAAGENRSPDTTALNAKLGALLNETHASCRDVYENSHPEVDEICRIALEAGAYGSRITGAGWGGCSVHLVPEEKVEAVKAAWEGQYFSKKELTAEQRAEAMVESGPGSGSALFVVEEGSLAV
ncbi:Galactokinase [Sodiomyces alkalinus F11]|uniref:Galactokinase n=1 Tax=Sodiomyces alkalinus (strain CBS 110278 / VKM F-3762 / F11) TaxID=1314773 RepID=A0A3N2Q348_SODAK|nr:Galactokinase [Sodiomyces alkalinus F11]ROT41170.1 Galactokinase [Sodiomyces alkalinus F11]